VPVELVSSTIGVESDQSAKQPVGEVWRRQPVDQKLYYPDYFDVLFVSPTIINQCEDRKDGKSSPYTTATTALIWNTNTVGSIFGQRFTPSTSRTKDVGGSRG
jgi:hypothetical protein